jgi:hypothetical protein
LARRPLEGEERLLAVDAGMRTGLALYARTGRLLWVQSRHAGTLPGLRRVASALVREASPLDHIVLEGGGAVGDVWRRAAAERGTPVVAVSAEVWRKRLLLDRQQRSGVQAKRVAIGMAMEVLRWSQVKPPRSLSDDAAEAVLIGLWGVLHAGWLKDAPSFVPARGPHD